MTVERYGWMTEEQRQARLRRLATYSNLWPWELAELAAAGITPTGGRTEVVDEGLPSEREQRTNDGDNEVDPVRKARFNEAVAYIRDYTGDWDFILSLRTAPPQGKWGTKWFRLSDRQVDVVLKAKARDAEREKERAERKRMGLDLSVLPTGTTRYAVENADGELTFIKVDHLDEGKWAGWVFVKQVVGGYDDRDLPRLGSQRPGDAYKGTFERLIQKVLDDPIGAATRYGLELGECSVCGRTLTDAESRAAGIGPKCAAKWESAA